MQPDSGSLFLFLLYLGLALFAAYRLVFPARREKKVRPDAPLSTPEPATEPVPGWLARLNSALPGLLTGRPFPVGSAPALRGSWLWLVPGLGLSLFLMLWVNRPGGSGWEIGLWLASIAALCAAVLWLGGARLPALKGRWSWLRSHWPEGLGLLAVLAAAVALRLVWLENHPYAFANDEGQVGLAGLALFSGGALDGFTIGWSCQPVLSFLPDTLAVGLLGRTVTAVRLISVLTGVLTVLCLYLLVRQEMGLAAAFGAAVLLAAMPPHIHFSRTGFHNIQPGLYAALCLWLTLRAVRRGSPGSYLLAGLACGSALYSYVGTRLVLGLAAAALGWFILFRRGYWQANRFNLAALAGAAWVVMAPMTGHFLARPQDFMCRIGQESIFRGGWLAQTALERGTSVFNVLVEQAASSTLVFASRPAPFGFYMSPQPYLPPLGALFLGVGVLVALLRLRQPWYFALNVWFWATILFGGILTVGAPQSQRLVMALPAAAVLVWVGLDVTARAAGAVWPKLGRLAWAGAAAAALVIALQGGLFYLGEYRQQAYYRDRSEEMILETARIQRQLGPQVSFVMLARPESAVNFPNYRFLLPGHNLWDVETAPEFAADQPVWYAAIPERAAELEAVRAARPGGVWLAFPRWNLPGETLFYAYFLNAGPPAGTPGSE